MANQDTDWALMDEGPPEQFGMGQSSGHYEQHFPDPGLAAAEAQRLADERGHVIRVIANFFPRRGG